MCLVGLHVAEFTVRWP